MRTSESSASINEVATTGPIMQCKGLQSLLQGTPVHYPSPNFRSPSPLDSKSGGFNITGRALSMEGILKGLGIINYLR